MLSAICACGANLSKFIVKDAPVLSAICGANLSKFIVKDALDDLSAAGRFLKLGDEESVPLQARCVPCPCWNDFRRATKSTMVKATYLAGPYASGVGDTDLKVAASASEDPVAADEFWQSVFDRSSYYRVELDVVAKLTPFVPSLRKRSCLYRGRGDFCGLLRAGVYWDKLGHTEGCFKLLRVNEAYCFDRA